ncbi:MarR family transcriptional regulator [Streptomyces sp. NBC_01221]|uniref:MarR family transcriptional regulator n=1 Tax=Streptomyces sp. NBC_01221 TaxID=2903782 RepID=UPI00225C005E|nr:MarR family transcriptional regulator [Streptomyces sp. NBC_01221]MCX4788202.1 MarR family transcriptional regulator [Streptomyces sp. NBC_01221]
MATENLSPALRTPASSRPYAKAKPGYGKRCAPDQRPPRNDDFALLPERERYIAGYVDRLPDGAAMDIKSLAKNLPLYGQMAVAGALKALGVAGHLRHVRCLASGDDQVRWVTRTFWSRTAHDNEWWDAFLTAEGSGSAPEAVALAPASTAVVSASSAEAETPSPSPSPSPSASGALAPSTAPPESAPAAPAPAPAAPAVPQQRTPESAQEPHSPAYLALAQLGRNEPRLTLSAADCGVLEELAGAWLARGVNTGYLTHALTSGLPDRVDSPVGFVRRRLLDKIPPRLPAAPTPAAPGTPVRRLMVECTECGAPGRPEALPDGLCLPCRTSAPDTDSDTTLDAALGEPLAERDIRALVGNLRDLLRVD